MSEEASVEEHGETDAITPHTKPFRAWGAAYQQPAGPSFWARIRAWLAGLFHRQPKVEGGDASVVEETESESEPRVSFDDLDAPWSEEAFPVEERRSSRPSAERPNIEDFQAPWDGLHESDEHATQSVAASDRDPLWDEPQVSASGAPAPEAIASEDLADVWTPRDESEPTEVAPEQVEEPQRPGFFARLFGRKKKADAFDYEALTEPAADEAPLDGAAAVAPVDADFASDVAASEAPAETDFFAEASSPVVVEEQEDSRVAPPSLDHSAQDAANLAALLGPIVPREPDVDVDTEAPTEAIAAASMEVEPPVVESEAVVESELVVLSEAKDLLPSEESGSFAELRMTEEAPVEDEVDPLFDPLFDEPVAAAMEPVAEPEPEKKGGFFSQLLKRVSRSAFTRPTLPPETEPVVDVEPEAIEPDAIEVEATADVVDEPIAVEEDHAALEARWGAPPAEPIAAPPAAEEELSSTQPFAAFRDARDDFHEEPAPDSDARITAQVDLTVVEAVVEGEKTDEFEVVAAPAGAVAETSTLEVVPIGFFARLLGKKPDATQSGEAPAMPLTLAAEAEAKLPFVLAKFRAFYNEIIRDKHQKSDVISGFATAIVSAAASDMADPEFAAQLLSKRLSEMLELQAAESNWTGGDAAKYYPEAQYAMVALADETFLHLEWAGRSSWHKYMLEPRMYGTRIAELEFFKRVDKLLKDNPDPPKGARDLARLYLMVIASGFRGKFRVPGVRRPLAEYRRRLYEFSHRADPLELYAKDRHIFPDATEHTLASKAVGRFTSAQKWIATVLILVAVYLVVSHVAWIELSADLKDVMSRIESTTTTTGGR